MAVLRLILHLLQRNGMYGRRAQMFPLQAFQRAHLRGVHLLIAAEEHRFHQLLRIIGHSDDGQYRHSFQLQRRMCTAAKQHQAKHHDHFLHR